METWARKTRGINRRGTRAVQPTANAVLEGTQYFVTDEFKIERSNGTNWESITGQVAAGSTTQVQYNNGGVLSGDADLVFDGNRLTSKLLTVNEGAVINESGANSDLRVEGITSPDLFFIDASADKIGIGTNAPVAVLDVRQPLAFGNLVAQFKRAAGNPDIEVTNDTHTVTLGVSATTGSGFVGTISNHTFQMRANNANILVLFPNGNVGLGSGIAALGTSAVNVIGLVNGTAPTSSPAGVGQVYMENGVLKYRGTDNTITTLGLA